MSRVNFVFESKVLCVPLVFDTTRVLFFVCLFFVCVLTERKE